MKKTISLVIALISCLTIGAQEFQHYFTDATLRIDYTFTGNAKSQAIAVDELCKIPRWYGKRQRLAELPVEGNGQITVRDHRSQRVIYRNSFSTLFQEWLSYDEAKTNTKAFQNVFLVPYPKDTIDVTLDLKNNRRQAMATLTHTVAPADILIRRIGEKRRHPLRDTPTGSRHNTLHPHRIRGRGIHRKRDARIHRRLPHGNGGSLRTRTVQVDEKQIQHRGSQSNVRRERNIGTRQGNMEKHRTALQLQHLLQRQIPDDTPPERPPRLARGNAIRTHYRAGEHQKLRGRRHTQLLQLVDDSPPGIQTRRRA